MFYLFKTKTTTMTQQTSQAISNAVLQLVDSKEPKTQLLTERENKNPEPILAGPALEKWMAIYAKLLDPSESQCMGKGVEIPSRFIETLAKLTWILAQMDMETSNIAITQILPVVCNPNILSKCRSCLGSQVPFFSSQELKAFRSNYWNNVFGGQAQCHSSPSTTPVVLTRPSSSSFNSRMIQ